MKYLFILGRNVQLSIAEVFSYFEKENNKIISCVKVRNSLLLDFEKPIGKVIDSLGGVISIGEVIAEGNEKELYNKIANMELYSLSKNKFNYVIWNFADEDIFSSVSHALKENFKREKVKATEKKHRGLIKMQNKAYIENVSSSSTLDEEYFVFEKCFGKIIQKCDYEKIEERDMKKPVRRSELSISPRLAKIMINLSRIKKGEMMLDPFCGIGVILQEALLQDVKVIGIDSDRNVISDAEKNLVWFKFKKENYRLIAEDSRRVQNIRAGVIVTEPQLGEKLKRIPSNEELKKLFYDFEKLMITVLRNIKNKVNGRIVFTSPFVKTSKGRISCNIERIVKETGLKIVKMDGIKGEGIDGDIQFPIHEFREDQIVGRDVVVLER